MLFQRQQWPGAVCVTPTCRTVLSARRFPGLAVKVPHPWNCCHTHCTFLGRVCIPVFPPRPMSLRTSRLSPVCVSSCRPSVSSPAASSPAAEAAAPLTGTLQVPLSSWAFVSRSFSVCLPLGAPRSLASLSPPLCLGSHPHPRLCGPSTSAHPLSPPRLSSSTLLLSLWVPVPLSLGPCPPHLWVPVLFYTSLVLPPHSAIHFWGHCLQSLRRWEIPLSFPPRSPSLPALSPDPQNFPSRPQWTVGPPTHLQLRPSLLAGPEGLAQPLPKGLVPASSHWPPPG